MTLLLNERDRTSMFVCSLVAFGWFSGAITNETKSVPYKYWGFVISRFIPTHFIITRTKKYYSLLYELRTPLYRGSLGRGSFVGIKLFLPGAVTIGKFCFVSFPAFTGKKTREPSASGAGRQFETVLKRQWKNNVNSQFSLSINLTGF